MFDQVKRCGSVERECNKNSDLTSSGNGAESLAASCWKGWCSGVLLRRSSFSESLADYSSWRAKDVGRWQIKLQNADNLTFFNSISSMRAEKGQVKDNEQVMPLLDAAANAINNAHW